jgi:hypothetical protein
VSILSSSPKILFSTCYSLVEWHATVFFMWFKEHFVSRISIWFFFLTLSMSLSNSFNPCLIPDSRGNGFFPHLVWVGYRLVYISFSVPSFIRTFMKGCWILLKAFSPSIEMIKWFLSLLLLICCITFNDLHMLKHLCVHGLKLNWSWYMICLICCWIGSAVFFDDCCI